MTGRRQALRAMLIAATILTPLAASANTLRWARSGDALTLDPHAQNEGPTHTLNHQIYEPLIIRDHAGKQMPALALSWSIVPGDPTTWEFRLRPGVKYHNGNPFNADDVVFSLERARQPTSDMKSLLSSVESITKVDDLTVRIKTRGPNPILPNNLGDMFMMDKEWAEANNATKVQDFKNRDENFAVRNANGTGPFKLVSREPDVRTVMRRNDEYWGRGEVPLEISELIYTPIKADATRVAALLSGEVDLVQDVPVQDVQRLQAAGSLRVNTGPENRSIFLGMDVGSSDLKGDDVQGKNPLADKRVRQAMNMAIDRVAINRVVMRGQSVPTGTISPPGVNGYTKELDRLPPVDVNRAKAMLAEAGYPNGFSLTFHCSNDRYINDEGVCQAAVGMLGRIGIKATLVSQSKSIHFPLVQKNPPETEFYLLGWGVPTFDSEYIFSLLHHTRTEKLGGWNATRYSNPEVDRLTVSLNSEIDQEKRNATIARIWSIVQEDTIYLPLHIQALSYAMKNNFDVSVDITNQPKLKMVAFKRS